MQTVGAWIGAMRNEWLSMLASVDISATSKLILPHSLVDHFSSFLSV